MQPSKPQPFRLPQRFDSPTLAKYAIPGEPTVIVRAVGVGSTAPFEYSDRNGRQAIFRYEREYDAHVLKVPASVWNHNKGFMAHELMDQRRLPHPLVVTVDIPTVEATSPIKGLIDAMKADPEYAWGWHCNLAMAMHDSGAGPHQACNQGAALFLSLLSDGAVDTTQHPAYENTQATIGTNTDLSSQGDLESSDPHKVASGGSIPPPDTTLTAIQEAILHADLTNLDWPDAILNMVTNPGAKGYLEANLTDLGARLATGSTEFRDAFLNIVNDMLASPVAPSPTDSPEMDAPGNSEEASDVVVGQAETQPGASATFSGPDAALSPDGSGTDMPTGNAPAPLYSRAWDMLESPMRLKELAATLETDPDTLKAAIQEPLSAVELGHAGWVKRREPQA